jgi:hypothetical protein
MANSLNGVVEFTVGAKGEERTFKLCFSINAICELEDRTGKTLMQIGEHMKEVGVAGIKMSMVRDILYAGLIEHQPNISVKEAGELITEAGGTIAVLNKFNEALNAAYGPTEASGTRGPPQAPNRRQRRRAGKLSS